MGGANIARSPEAVGGAGGRLAASFALGLALAILAAVGLVTHRATLKVVDTAEWVEHTHEVIEHLEGLRGAVANAESARRGYALVGDVTMLSGYAEALERVTLHRGAVRSLTVDNALQQTRLDELEEPLRSRLAMFDRAIADQRARGMDAARERQVARESATSRERIASIIAAMIDEERRLLAIREQRTSESITQARLVQVAGTLTSLVLLLVAFGLLRVEVARRLRSAQALRESEESLATTLHSIGDGVISTDAEGRISRMNPVAEALTGFPLGLARGKPFTEVFRIEHEETRLPVADPVARALAEGVAVALANHTVLIARDGTITPIADSAAPIRDDRGNVTGAVLVFRDVTADRAAAALAQRSSEQLATAAAALERRVEERTRELVEADVVARESAALFRTAIEGSLDAFYIFDSVRDDGGAVVDMKFVEVNSRAMKRLSRTREQLIGRRLTELFPVESIRSTLDVYARVAESGHAIEDEMRVNVPGVEVSWIRHQVVPLATGVAVTSADISRRRHAEELLRRSEEQFRLLVNGVTEYALYTLDATGHVTTWNGGAARIKGYAAEEIVGNHVSAFYLPADVQAGRPAECLAAAARMDRYEEEGQRVRKDGTSFWASVATTAIRDGQGTLVGYAAITRDLTERRSLEEQLHQSQKLEAIGSLAGGVAHDFNNLLSVVLSYSEMLAADLKHGDPMRADLEEITRAGLRAVDLTRQLLAFSRQQVLQPKVVNLAETIYAMEKMLRRLIGEDIELSVHAAPHVRSVLVDPGQVEQVIMNLAVNARDAMPTGGKLTLELGEAMLDDLYASSRIGVNPGLHVMLAVTDTGTGMSPATQARIFEPFFTTKEKGKGTGLGLATVFGIVRQSGGTIWVYSELGRGTTFKVYFPMADRTAALSSASPPSDRRRLSGTETILLVEDEDGVRNVVRTILRKYGYEVIEARHGDDAVMLCEQHAGVIDLMLTDVVMPRVSGRELAERLSRVRPAMKVVYMSGYTDDAIVRHGVLDSKLAFIQKPITPEALARKLREVLAS